jgi:hypothetical protein
VPGIAFFQTDLYYRTDRFTGDTSSGGNVLQPDLTVPKGSTGLEVGWRQERHQYKNYTRNTPTLIAKWNF